MATKKETTKAPTAPAKAEKKIEKFVVADGKSITSKKGVLGAGAEVKPGYLGGGESAFKALIEAKIIVGG